MALVSRLPARRIPIPNEENEWVELKPLTAGVALDVKRADMGPAEATVAVLLGAITAWSYPVPVDEAGLRDLDSETFRWMQEQLDLTSGVRDDAEKKDSGINSLPATSPLQMGTNGFLTSSEY